MMSTSESVNESGRSASHAQEGGNSEKKLHGIIGVNLCGDAVLHSCSTDVKISTFPCQAEMAVPFLKLVKIINLQLLKKGLTYYLFCSWLQRP